MNSERIIIDDIESMSKKEKDHLLKCLDNISVNYVYERYEYLQTESFRK